jgi:hypothetical protein
VRRVGHGKRHDDIEPAGEGLVHVLLAVGGEDRDAVVLFHALKQIIDLHIGVAMVGVFDLAAFAELGVRFVEEENRAVYKTTPIAFSLNGCTIWLECLDREERGYGLAPCRGKRQIQ